MWQNDWFLVDHGPALPGGGKGYRYIVCVVSHIMCVDVLDWTRVLWSLTLSTFCCVDKMSTNQITAFLRHLRFHWFIIMGMVCCLQRVYSPITDLLIYSSLHPSWGFDWLTETLQLGHGLCLNKVTSTTIQQATTWRVPLTVQYDLTSHKYGNGTQLEGDTPKHLLLPNNS